MAYRTDSVKRPRGGRSCVAGGPNLVSCTNTQHIEGISFHRFPNEEKDPQRRRKWVNFVRKHRPKFKPSATSSLCSAHFDDSCYNMNLAMAKSLGMRRVLNDDAVPTVDVAGIVPPIEERSTERKQRQIVRRSKRTSPRKLAYSSEKADEHRSNESSDNFDDSAHGDDFHLDYHARSSCTSCNCLKKKIKSLQKALSKYKKSKAKLRKKVLKLQAENKSLAVLNSPSTNTAESTEADMRADSDEDSPYSDGEMFVDYSSLEESSHSGAEMPDVTKNTVSCDEGTSPYNEPMFLASFSCLKELFGMFCFNCKGENPVVQVKRIGSCAIVEQVCSKCLTKNFSWRSQPMVLERHYAGNIMTSFGILMSGINISQVMLMFRHMNLQAITVRTYHNHQRDFLIPSILKHWEVHQSGLIEEIKKKKESQTWSGDGRFDSMGHNAKYGVYTMFSNTTSKLVHFELLQANEVGSSNAMELEGAKRSFKFLKNSGLRMDVFISDRHKGIAKWIRTKEKETKHYNDIWHVNKSINKQLRKVSKEKGCEVINDWMKAVRNHLYWSVQSTVPGFEALIVAKWRSTVRHIAGKHEDHPDALFPSCGHGELEPRKWIPIGTTAYDRLSSVLLKKNILKDVAKLSPDAQTSCLEGFHSTLNHWHPKMTHFSWLGTFVRHIIAILHFNENLNRKAKKTKDGRTYFNVTFPKFKLGEEVVREVPVPPTYDYVKAVMNTIFTTSEEERSNTSKKYQTKVPEPLCKQFPDRKGRGDAIKRHHEKKELAEPELFPSLQQQTQQQKEMAELQQVDTPSEGTQPRKCKKCKHPMKGHPRGRCPDSSVG